VVACAVSTFQYFFLRAFCYCFFFTGDIDNDWFALKLLLISFPNILTDCGVKNNMALTQIRLTLFSDQAEMSIYLRYRGNTGTTTKKILVAR